MKNILTITDLNKKFGRIHAVKNLSLNIQKGNIYGILGPNGSGKSTTLGIVLNVVNKSSGDFCWFDGTLQTHEALKKVGAIIERPNFYPYMTAEENLNLVCKIKKISIENVKEKLELVGLYDRKDYKFRTFSLGMKQRLAIASALLNNPEILILDEPTNGLDPSGIHQIRDIIKQIATNGTTILLASHLLDEVEKICSHVLILRKGEMIYSGKIEDMSKNNVFFEIGSEDLYLLETKIESLFPVKKIKHDTDFLKVNFDTEISAKEINQKFFDAGITLNHLAKKKESLENVFLTLTQSSSKN